MQEKRLKIDFWLVFWTILIIINILAMLASWYTADLMNYWFCAIMLMYCVVGAYMSLPEDKQK